MRGARLRAWAFFGALAFGALVSRPAEAYRVYVSDTGAGLHWPGSSVAYRISEVAPADLPWEVFEAAVHQAVATWADQSGCRIPQLVYGGTSSADQGGFDASGEGENLVVFIRDPQVWSAKGFESYEVAITSLTHRTSDGEIVDADVELNDSSVPFFAGPLPPPPDPASAGWDPVPDGEIDLLSTLVHELGHFYGLDHSDQPAATMFATIPGGESIKRSLDPDDVEGLCSIYAGRPPDGADATGADAGTASDAGGDAAGDAVSDARGGGRGAGRCGAGRRPGIPGALLTLLGACWAMAASRRLSLPRRTR